MALLGKYALTPDVFDKASYSSEELGRLLLQQLKEVLVSEGLVYDLRDGRWARQVSDSSMNCHHLGKELLKKLQQQNRLHRVRAVLPHEPLTGTD